MSARMETEPVSWESAQRISHEMREGTPCGIEAEDFMRNEEKAGIPPSLPEQAGENARLDMKRIAALSVPEQRQRWITRREQMCNEIRRGREFLEQVQRELAVLRARMDEWPGYEVVCGKNPLSDYMQAIAARERIEEYLPVWVKRREDQLRALDQQIEHSARQNGVEHLL